MIRISKNERLVIKFIIMLIPVFEPKICTQIGITTLLYILLNLVELMLFCMAIASSEKARRVNYPIVAWLIYRLYMLLIMCIMQHYSGIMQWGYLSLMIINLLFTFEYANRQNAFYQLMEAIAVLGAILLFVNYVTIIKLPRGIISAEVYYMADNDYYFLGIKTQFTTMMFPTVAAAGTLFFYEKNKKNIFIFVAAIMSCLLNIFVKHISTPTVGIFIIIIGFIIGSIIKIEWKSKWLFLCAILFQCGIVFFNIQVYFTKFILNVLHKDTTLSSRIYIWQSAKKILKEESFLKLLLGNGMYKLNAFVPYAGSRWQPHNQLLVWLHSSGILGTFLIILFFIKLTEGKIRNKQAELFLVLICSAELFLSVSEVYFDVAVCFVPFFIMFYIRKYEKNNVKNQ